MKDFLEATYNLKADRLDIELMILRLIPLMSINSSVFLNAPVPAIDSFHLEEGGADKDDAHGNIWNIFVKRILADGYIPPATVKQLGRRHLSWIVEWPDHSFKSTTIFNTLQYVGRLGTVNDIPPLEVHPGSDCTELYVDGSRYVIKPGDLDKIIYMTPGVYPMQETMGRKWCYDPMIQEVLLNGELYQAIIMTNEIVQKVNQWLANPKRGGSVMSKIVRKKPDYQPFLNDVRGTGRLVEVFANPKHSTLAVSYKIDGRKISRFDAFENIARDVR